MKFPKPSAPLFDTQPIRVRAKSLTLHPNGYQTAVDRHLVRSFDQARYTIRQCLDDPDFGKRRVGSNREYSPRSDLAPIGRQDVHLMRATVIESARDCGFESVMDIFPKELLQIGSGVIREGR